MRKWKGQTISMDLVLACVIFGILLAYVMNTLHTGYQQVSDIVMLRDITMRANMVETLLTETPGTPSDWENNPGESILLGLAPRPGIISLQKLSALEAFEYEELKQKARTGGYEMHVIVTLPDGQKMGEAGLTPAGVVAVSRNRLASCEGKPCTVRVTLWARQ